MKRQLPDKIYLILEETFDKIIEELGENEIHGHKFHMVEREFRFMIRNKRHEARKSWQQQLNMV